MWAEKMQPLSSSWLCLVVKEVVRLDIIMKISKVLKMCMRQICMRSMKCIVIEGL